MDAIRRNPMRFFITHLRLLTEAIFVRVGRALSFEFAPGGGNYLQFEGANTAPRRRFIPAAK
jgi:hypothetical protein